ncbi:MAG: response regulator transcription factor [Rhodothermales bacterium]
MSLRIFLIDDHPIVREGMGRLIDREPDMTLCGESDGDDDPLGAIEKTQPDVVVLDLSLPRINGLDMIADIKLRAPATRVFVLSMHDEKLYAERVIRAGAMGYIMKQEAPAKVLDAIRTVASGSLFLSPDIAQTVIKGMMKPRQETTFSALSDREFQVFVFIGEGKTLQEIAERLSLSVKTIESHVERIKTKLDIGSGRELMRRAIEWVLRNQGPSMN